MSDVEDLARLTQAHVSIATLSSIDSRCAVKSEASSVRIYGSPVIQAGAIDMFSILLGGLTGSDGENERAGDVAILPTLSSSATIQAGIN